MPEEEVRAMEEGATGQGMQVPLEAGKGKETDSPPQPPERTQLCQYLFQPTRPILDF